MCIFLSLVYDIHIIVLAFIVHLAFDHFVFKLAFVGLLVHLCKYLAWLPLVCLLASLVPMIFITHWMTLRFWAAHWV